LYQGTTLVVPKNSNSTARRTEVRLAAIKNNDLIGTAEAVP